jgi:2-polyprenyl-3-methyl-5-hydroxy-6-metoxy-1,4-benzoquinol methylase
MDIPFDGTFDLILSRELLSHSRSPSWTLHYLLERLNPGGYLYLEEPELLGHLRGPLANRLIVVHYQHLIGADLRAYAQKLGLRWIKWGFVWSKKVHRVLLQKTATAVGSFRPQPLTAQARYQLLRAWALKDRWLA